MVPDSATVIDLDDQNTVFELKEMDANVIDVEKEAMCNGSVEFSGSMRFRGRLNLRARKRPDIFTPAVEPPSKRQKTGSSEKASAKISRKKKTPSKEENQDVAKEVVLPSKLLKKEEASFEEELTEKELTDEKPSKSTSSSKKKKIVRAKVDKAIKGLKQKARKVKEERVEDESTTTEADEEEAEEPEGGDFEEEEEQDEDGNNEPVVKKPIAKRKGGKICVSAAFPGKPIPQEEAKRRWPLRYQKKAQKIDPLNSDQEITQAVSHYEEAEVDHAFYKLGDCVTVNAGDGPDYLGRVVEFFKAANNELWFTAQWFFHLEDTAVGQVDGSHDEKRIFYSEVKDDNLLECITGKIKVVQVSSLANFQSNSKNKPIPPCDYYYDMGYSYSYSTFYELSSATAASSDEASSVCNGLTSSRVAATAQSGKKVKAETSTKMKSEARPELKLLDLYSGCGGMSTGLGMGCNLAGANLITRWALDLNEFACQSLKYNHPETEVRNEDAESFLNLIKEWQKLCGKYPDNGEIFENDDDGSSSDLEEGEYEVEKIIGIRWGSPEDSEKKEGTKKKKTIQLKVHWKGYGEEEDSWEPIDGLESAQERIKEFVILGQRTSMLPLPGKVDVICGGPPCQGASGFNRFRKVDAPLECPRNRQMKVYMDIVEFLRPRFILMENVVDILKFAKGFLGRFALSRLVNMHYQAKLGLMVAGCYGLPQFRMRVFLWGAAPTEKLPPFPLPTHNVVQRGGIPNDWERNVVAYDETQRPQLQKVLHLGHAISDLPPVGNAEKRNEMAYDSSPKTPFQHYIRSPKDALYGVGVAKQKNQVLYDHRPLQLNNDDYQRVCQIPKRKGANFRDLTGVRVRSDNVVELDPDVERVYLASGKPLVPDYAISFVKGKSIKPFARLWWDETVPTVVTRAEPHNQQILHPEQDRVLTIRENARLQGFPDYYKLFGPVKQKYIQIGNAVAVPVGRALGYSLGLAIQHECPDAPVIELPKGFPQSLSCPAARGVSGPETSDEAVATVVPLED